MTNEQKTSAFTWFLGKPWYKKYLLPGFIAQSVVVAGGYGTGRELVEYFVNYGPTGGLMGMFFVTIVLWALVFAVSYEFARSFKAYDYRSFFKALLGPGWILYEICYIVLLLIVLGVVAATSGAIFLESFGLPFMAGAGLFLIGVVALTYWGSRGLEIVLSWWSYLLYAVFLAFLVVGISKVGGDITANLSLVSSMPSTTWGLSRPSFLPLTLSKAERKPLFPVYALRLLPCFRDFSSTW